MRERAIDIVVFSFLICSSLQATYAEDCSVENFRQTDLNVDGNVGLPRATIRLWTNLPEDCSLLTGLKIRIENTHLPEDRIDADYPSSCLHRTKQYFQLEIPSSRCPGLFEGVPFKHGCSRYNITVTPRLNNQLHSQSATVSLVTSVTGNDGEATNISFVPGSRWIQVRFKPPVCDETATVAYYKFPVFLRLDSTFSRPQRPDDVYKVHLHADGEFFSFNISHGAHGGPKEEIKPCSDYKIRVRSDFDTAYGSLMKQDFAVESPVTTLPDLTEAVELQERNAGPDWLELRWRFPYCKKQLTAWRISVEERIPVPDAPNYYEILLDSNDLRDNIFKLKVSTGKFEFGSRTKENQLTIRPSNSYVVSIQPKYTTISEPGAPLTVVIYTKESEISRFDVVVHEDSVDLTVVLNSDTLYVYLQDLRKNYITYKCSSSSRSYRCDLKLRKVGTVDIKPCQSYTLGVGTYYQERTQTFVTPPGSLGTISIDILRATAADVVLELSLNSRCSATLTAVYLTLTKNSELVLSQKVPESCMRSHGRLQLRLGSASDCPVLWNVTLEHCSRYDLSLLPELGGKYNGTPAITELTTEPEGSKGHVQNISVQVQKLTVESLQWRLPECQKTLEIDTYSVQLKKIQQREAVACSFTLNLTTMNDFSGRLRLADYCNNSLESCSNYSTSVSVRYRGLRSLYTQSHTFLTEPGEDDGHVDNIKITPDETEFDIDWANPRCQWSVDWFQISLDGAKTGVEIPSDCRTNRTSRAVITANRIICGNFSIEWESLHLKPCSNYTVHVKPRFTDFGYGLSLSKNFTTAIASVASVTDVKAVEVGPTYAKIEWPADPSPQCILQYEVTVTSDTSEEAKDISSFQTKETRWTVENLTAGNNYSVTIAVRLISGELPREGRNVKLEFTTPAEEASTGRATLWIGLVVALVILLFIVIGISIVRKGSKVKKQPNCHEEVRDEDLAMLPRRERPVPLRQLPELAAIFAVTSTDELKTEYNYLVTMSEDNLPAMTVGVLPENKAKNRYFNILPFDFNRVTLQVDQKSNQTDYVNASFIPGLNGEREYIAAQAPKEAVLFDFWRMIWEQNVEVIVMLTGLVEKGKAKCEQYWPDDKTSSSYEGRIVMHLKEETHGFFTIRQLGVSQGKTKRVITQFHYTDWPDHGCPKNPEHLLSFLHQVRGAVSTNDGDTGPILVHCSAGVGRTGTFIALDILTQMAETSDQLDIFGTVLRLRDYRVKMVQTIDQYAFLYACMSHFVQTRLHIGQEPLYSNVAQVNSRDGLIAMEMEDVPL